jgi:hypothetical protein
MKDEWVRTRKKLDRLGRQDKSRKVRPVGRLENAGDFKHAPNIAKIRHTLRFLQCRCSCSAFDTLCDAMSRSDDFSRSPRPHSLDAP